MDVITLYMNQLFSLLQSTCPVDTGNMLKNIKMEETDDAFFIYINAPHPNGNYDYARAVNYGLKAKAENRQMSSKEKRNYHWVERAVKQSADLVAERVLYYE